MQTWAWGQMSSTEVQKEALRSHNDYQIMLSSIPLNEDYMPRSLYELAQLGTREPTLAVQTESSKSGLVNPQFQLQT